MDKIITAKEVLQAQSIAKTIWDNIETVRKNKDHEIYNIQSEYRHKIWDIEREQNDKIRVVTELKEKESELLKFENKPNIGLIKKAERIIEFLKLKQRDLSINDDNVIVRNNWKNGEYKESLGYFVNNDHLVIKIYIISNEKPSNKYSLIAYGNSFFYDNENKLINFNKIKYGVNSAYYKENYPNIEATIKDFKTVEEARAYYKSKHDVILNDFMIEHNSVELEYQEVITSYSLSDFRELIVLECPECKKFYTVFDSLSEYNLDNYECNKHDKNIKMVRV